MFLSATGQLSTRERMNDDLLILRTPMGENPEEVAVLITDYYSTSVETY